MLPRETLILFALIFIQGLQCRPQVVSLVSTQPPTDNLFNSTHDDDDQDNSNNSTKPIISSFHVRSDIQFRFARTSVESYIKNPSKSPQEISFTMILPDTAFISNFSMLIKDEEFVANVQKKEQARETFDQAVYGGRSAGLVETRDANKISVSANVEGGGKIRFRLTYEELLRRHLERYEHVIHVSPGQIVKDFKVDVFINESLPVTGIKVPQLKTDPNSITSRDANPLAEIIRDPEDESKVRISFNPSTQQQKDQGDSSSGLSGQFIVQYDVDRKHEGNDVQTIDGYFVHFFSPDQLKTLPKHVVFVLDISGSMFGEKLAQTKDAMVTVIDDLTELDHFNIITFSDQVYHWAPESERLLEAPHQMTYKGTKDTRNEALSHVLKLKTIGGTNINDGLIEALQLVKKVKQAEVLPVNTKPIIVFLTDGEPTTGVTNGDEIKENVRTQNKELEVPIYGLAFGSGADFQLMKTLSLENRAFARRIYEGSDAAIQLEDFYQEIASPLLSDVRFDYVGELENATVTKSVFNDFNRGNEIVIAGKIKDDAFTDVKEIEVGISGDGADGHFHKKIRLCVLPAFNGSMTAPIPFARLQPIPLEADIPLSASGTGLKNRRPHPLVDPLEDILPMPVGCIPVPPRKREPRSDAQNFVERLWAFLTIKDLLDEKASRTEERKKELTVEEEQKKENDEEEVTAIPLVEDKEETNKKIENPVVLVAKEKTSKEKALDLALKYNFVTSITSLVVVRPNETESNSTLSNSVDLEPVSSTSSSSPLGSSSMLFAHRAYSGPAPGSGMFGGNRFSMPRINGITSSQGRPMLMQAPMRKMAVRPAFPAPPPPPAQVLFSASAASSSYDDYDPSDVADDDDEFDGPVRYTSSSTNDVSTTTAKTSCSGSISLFSKTYLRGDNATLTDDEADLANVDFEDKLTSLEVVGDCCWQIFAEVGFKGEAVTFRKGQHKSASEMRFLFRKAESVRRVVQC